MNRADILDTARQAVMIDRAATHGNLEDNFSTIAAIWSVRCGVPITAPQVAIMMCDLKSVRAWGNPTHGDNWVDLAGYAACGGEIATQSEGLPFDVHHARREAERAQFNGEAGE